MSNYAGKRRQIVPAIWLLIVVLAIEGLFATIIWVTSAFHRSAYSSVIVQMPEDASCAGVSLSLGTEELTVNKELVNKLSELNQQKIQMLQLTIDFLGHSSGSRDALSIDHAWQGQTASAMEMVFQSGYQVMLHVPLKTDSAWNRYVTVWKRIDDAYGHRPAREMRYQLVLPNSLDIEKYVRDLDEVITYVRGKNPGRRVLIAMPEQTTADDLKKMAEYLSNMGVDFGIPVSQELTEEMIFDLIEAAGAIGGDIVLLSSEQMKETQLQENIQVLAQKYQLDYILSE